MDILGLSLVINWCVIGLWISSKRDWYKKLDTQSFSIFMNMLFMPVALGITLWEEFIKKDWNN